jgi:YidC/Oxa1 family membrane protein insertase
MAFMLVVLAAFLGYQYFFNKPKPEEQPPAATQTQPAAPVAQAAQGPAKSAAASAQPPSATPQIAASIETVTTVENEIFKIEFTNRGAQVEHWILKKYFDSTGKPLDLCSPRLPRTLRLRSTSAFLCRSLPTIRRLLRS